MTPLEMITQIQQQEAEIKQLKEQISVLESEARARPQTTDHHIARLNIQAVYRASGILSFWVKSAFLYCNQ